MNFYVTLPSNSRPENKTSDFIVHLPHKIQLDGDWEVALVEVSYPYSWNNISTGQNRILVTLVDGSIIRVYVPTGHYNVIGELLNAITYGIEATARYLRKRNKRSTHPVFNSVAGRKVLEDFSERAVKATTKNVETKKVTKTQLVELPDCINFSYQYTLKRVLLTFDAKVVQKVELSKHLQYALGFEKHEIVTSRTTAKHPIDLRAGVDGFYMYCNLIESQIVGGYYVPLLRIVHVDGQYGDIVDKTFYSPHYIPVLSKEFDRIEINIKNDINQCIPFEFGKVVAKLHFRKRSMFAK